MLDPNWGPTGLTVYERTYQRVKPDGTRENYEETCERVARGNLELVYGPQDSWQPEVWGEYYELVAGMFAFQVMPAGRHYWASGVKGRQYLFNCHVAPWGEKFSRHFAFTFMQLMSGGGVGANYSSRFLKPYGPPKRPLTVHVVCDPTHPDYDAMKASGVLSEHYTAEWDGAFEVEDSREGWAAALTDILDTYYADEVKHDNRVYDVTNVRPSGSRLKTFGGSASGPEPLALMLNEVAAVMNVAADPVNVFTGHDYVNPLQAMAIDHAIAKCVVSGGNRRSARMSIVEWDDPFIMEFIACKADTGDHWTTNISVAITDEFLDLLDHWEKIKGTGVMIPSDKDMAAKAAWFTHKAVTEGMLANGEPGYWNYSLSQIGEIEEVISTNPCGEIVLTPAENCNLGHVNLQAFVDNKGMVDWVGMLRAHRLVTRFLIRATFGDVTDDQQADILARNRRIGVGHLGVQGHLVKRGIKWSEAPSRGFNYDLVEMRDTVRQEARDYAFALRIPEPIKVTTVAPTGSIAKMPGVSEGIHPIYSRYFIRRVRFSTVDPVQLEQAAEFERIGYSVEPCLYAPNTVVVAFATKDNLVAEVEDMGFDPDLVESADEISLEDMLKFQTMYQRHYADNAISFTVNVPEGKYSVSDVADTLRRFLPGLKGTTIMPDGTRPQAPYERLSRETYEAAELKAIADGIDEDCANGACPIR